MQRMSGILLHPTSLPGPGGVGAFGDEARRFVDFLHDAGQSVWQILPLGPTGYGNSPYSCYSAFAGNPLLIDLNAIATEGDLNKKELAESLPQEYVDFGAVGEYKFELLRIAAERFFANNDLKRKHEFWNYCDTTFWLHDHALFMALKGHFKGNGWNRWPKTLMCRDQAACVEYSHLLGHEIGFQKYMQWQFFRQWRALKSYAVEKGIRVIGDAPIFVAYDSSDVWCNQQLFLLDDKGSPLVVAGVPPDYFSKTGQRWGNPLYDWKRLSDTGYEWWIARLKNDLAIYDIVRIDHFRGFEAFWAIPAKEKTAVKGSWVKGPGEELFSVLKNTIGALPLIAEDLGVITDEVVALRDKFNLPGMKILQFAFDGGPKNGYLPHNHIQNSVVYTGTHDNDTTQGWFDKLTDQQKRRICAYLRCDPAEIVREMIRATSASVACLAVYPLQDILGLDSNARMNTPGTASGNWGWRFNLRELESLDATYLRDLTELYGRLPVC